MHSKDVNISIDCYVTSLIVRKSIARYVCMMIRKIWHAGDPSGRWKDITCRSPDRGGDQETRLTRRRKRRSCIVASIFLGSCARTIERSGVFSLSADGDPVLWPEFDGTTCHEIKAVTDTIDIYCVSSLFGFKRNLRSRFIDRLY